MELFVVTSDIMHKPAMLMVATYSPVGLKSIPVMNSSKEYSKFDVSITIDNYRIGNAILTFG